MIGDGLGCFTALTRPPRPRGHRQRAVRIAAFEWVNTAIGNIKNSIQGTSHAIRPEHVPRELAQFECRFDRRDRLEGMVPRLAWVARRTPPMPYRLLKLAEKGA